MSDLINAWGAAKTQSERAKLIKQYGLQVGVSKLRPGEVKLGIANELKMNSKKEIPALDLAGELIIITGNPTKIKYPFKAGTVKEGVMTTGAAKFKSVDNHKLFATGGFSVEKDGNEYFMTKVYKLPSGSNAGWNLSNMSQGADEDGFNTDSSVYLGKEYFGKGRGLADVAKMLNKDYAAKFVASAGTPVKEDALELGTDKAMENHIDNTPGQKEIEETLERRKLGDYKSTLELIKKEIPSYADVKVLPHVAAFLSVQFKKSLGDVKRDLGVSQSVTESLESEWLGGSIQKRKDLIKKHDLKVGISSVRPGEVKLGISNELNGRKDVYALDGNNKLIVVSGTAKSPKIRYVKESKTASIKSIRAHAVVELATGEKNPTVRESFLESGKADMSSTLKLVDSFKAFYTEAIKIDDLYEVVLKWNNARGNPKMHAKVNELGMRQSPKAGYYIFTGDMEGIVELLKTHDDGATDFIRNSDWKGLMKHYGAVPALRGFPKVK